MPWTPNPASLTSGANFVQFIESVNFPKVYFQILIF